MASITKRVTKAGVTWRIQIRRRGEKLICRNARTKGEAQELARRIEAELDLGKKVSARTMTVAALIDRHLNDLGTTFEAMGREDVLTRSKGTSLRHIRRLLGAVEICDQDNRKIVQFARDRRALTPCFSSTACWKPDRPEGTGLKRSKFTEEQIIGVLREQRAGATVAEVRRRHGMSSATHLTPGSRSTAAWTCPTPNG